MHFGIPIFSPPQRPANAIIQGPVNRSLITPKTAVPLDPKLVTRRSFLRRGAVATVAGLGIYAFGIEPRWVSVDHHDLPIPDLPDHLVNATAIQISDLHVGRGVEESYLRRQFDYIDALKPDFVFFTGDYLDNATQWHTDKGIKLLSHMPRGKLGTACVLGNHDYGGSTPEVAKNAPNTERLINAFEDQGLNLLINDAVELSGLNVVGLPDLWYGNFWQGSFQKDFARDLIASTANSGATITLSHNPDTADLPIWDGYQSWILCGHTHGGQCKFPIIGAPRLPVANYNYVSGKYQIEGGHKMYINRGIGHSARVRFMARPEITVFRLTSAGKQAKA